MTKERMIQAIDAAFDAQMAMLLKHYCEAISTIGDRGAFQQFAARVTVLLKASANAREMIELLSDEKKTLT